MSLKKCSKCGVVKPVGEFSLVSRNLPNLRQGYCKECFRVIGRERNRELRKRASQLKEGYCSYCRTVLPISVFSSAGQPYCKNCRTEYDRKRLEKRKVGRRRKIFTNSNYRLKEKARGIAQRLKYEPCESCGTEDKIERHHSDYTKPLQVVYLCRVCHAKIHRYTETHNSEVSPQMPEQIKA